MESDLELAFRLQMEEAIAASIASLPSSPSASSSAAAAASSSRSESPAAVEGDSEAAFDLTALRVLEKLEQERRDRELCEAEARRMRHDLSCRIRDQKFAEDLSRMPDEEWEDFGDEVGMPSGEGSSSDAPHLGKYETYRLFFKGLLSEERVGNSGVPLCGIGIAICDPRDNLIFELKKPLKGVANRHTAELKALLEGLTIALSLDLKRIVFFFDYYPTFQYVRGRWQPKQRKVAELVKKVANLEKKFEYCRPFHVPRNFIKYVFKLARDAIASEITRSAESSSENLLKEACVICLEETRMDQMFCIADCSHKYCFSCMNQHVEVKLLHGMWPRCPHEGCKSVLYPNNCEKFLTPKLCEIFKQRLKEASVPTAEKLYCPFPRCSELMSKSQASDFAARETVLLRNMGQRKCVKCGGLFCVNCNVPWHRGMTCTGYKRINPCPPEDRKLKNLACLNLWRQCPKCNHMIELAEGCYHMTCRCGHQFCYTCGAEWRTINGEKKPTCNCPLFDHDYEDDEDDDDFDEDDDDDDEDDDEYYSESDSDESARSL